MAIFKNNSGFDYFYYGTQPLQTIYQGTKIIWEGIRSCYGAGYWVPTKPWLNNEGWKYYNKNVNNG